MEQTKCDSIMTYSNAPKPCGRYEAEGGGGFFLADVAIVRVVPVGVQWDRANQALSHSRPE
jgi:hypothetical protein